MTDKKSHTARLHGFTGWAFIPNDRYYTGVSIACEDDDGAIYWGDLERSASYAVTIKAKGVGVTDAVLCGGIQHLADARAIVAALTQNNRPPKTTPHCSNCGSTSVLIDAWAEWDDEAQEWSIQDVFNSIFCQDCDGETSIEWKEIP